jgi:peptidoglycan hydrolase-like protein with peptidoglycan-binding domain
MDMPDVAATAALDAALDQIAGVAAARRQGPGSGNQGNAETLRRYWAEGEGAAKIRWGQPGDFDRCRREMVDDAKMTPEQAAGYCNLLHKRALGFYPATHAHMLKGAAADGDQEDLFAAATWDESAHPRQPAGQAGGGQFAPGATGAAPTSERPVGQGQAGPQVRDLQQRLNALGAKLTVDGIFGPKTLAAVRAFQSARGLTVDGLVGPKTTAALRATPKAKPKATPKATPKAAAGPAPGLPALVTIPGVDLLAAGTWQLSTGRQTFTRGDLESAIDAAGCPSVGPPVIKIGHLDQRFAPGPADDGEPAIGRVANLRLNDAGTKLVGDLAGMPGWLGAISASAFPRRSVEGKFGFRCQIGHDHPFVLTALALLGVTPPGIGVLGQLDDIASLYGLTASAPGSGGWRMEPADQEEPAMPVTEEDVRRAYYAQAGAPQSWWITELQMAPTQLIVADEEDGAIYRVPFTINGAAVEFGTADRVASYEDVAASRGTGPVMVYASAEQSRAVIEAGPPPGGPDQVGGVPDEDGLDASWDDPEVGDVSDLTLADLQAADRAQARASAGQPDDDDDPEAEADDEEEAAEVEAAAKLGTGARFKAMVAKGMSPELVAWIGRKKYGKARFGKLAAAARRRKAAAAAGDPEGMVEAAGNHGPYDGEHTHPHSAFGDQGGDATHDHAHRHTNDAVHQHVHQEPAAASAASTQQGGDSGMGYEFTDEEMTAIRSRLGIKDGDPVTSGQIAAAFRAPPAPVAAAAAGQGGDGPVQVPEITDGTYLVDGDILRGYQQRAIAGDHAVRAMHVAERDTVLAAAVSAGKFAQARLDHFKGLWDRDPDGTRTLVASLAAGLVPMGGPVGSNGDFVYDPDLGDFEAQDAYRSLYPDDAPGGSTSAPGVRVR